MKRLELCDGVQSWVSRVKRRGLSTHPWGAPVFSVMVLDVLMPTRTAWGLPVRKSNSQLHREVVEPQLDQFVSELLRDDCVECWTEVYEQHPDIWVFFCPRQWTAVRWHHRSERLDLYANWKGSREGGRTDLMCCMTSRSKHFMRIGVSATGR